jgi:hypothetical protein
MAREASRSFENPLPSRGNFNLPLRAIGGSWGQRCRVGSMEYLRYGLGKG